jgi:hypothetical protein
MLKGLEGETAYRIANCLEAQETFSSAFRVFDSHQETDFYRVSISLVRRIIPYVEHKFDNRNPNSLSNFDGMTSVLLIPYVSPKPFSANDSEYSLDKELIWLEDISKKAVEYINASVIKYPTWRSSRGTRIDFSKNVVFQGFSTKILGGKKYLAMTVSEKK